jgi:signal transduction histidine kinase
MSELQHDERVLLSRAFAQFSQTSERLEAQFDILKKETELLKRKLRAKEEEVKRAERLATLGKTAAAVAHEVRNPLAALRLFLGLLTEEVADRTSCRQIIDEMERSIRTINHVVENILRFARARDVVHAPVNVHAILRSALAQVFPRGTSEIIVEVQEQAHPFMLGDEVALLQAFTNLFMNAVQAMKGKGRLQVTSSGGTTDRLSIKIADTGPGISPQVAENLFDPFITTKSEGTGLGLAIVRQIVESHRGEITATNRSDGFLGAVFTVTFARK